MQTGQSEMGDRDWKRLGGFAGVKLLLLHAGLSAYWAAGGTALLGLLSDGINEMAAERATSTIAMIWSVAVLKVAVALIGLGVLRGWFTSAVAPLALAVTRVVALGLVLYAGMQLAGGLLVVAGLIESGAETGTAFRAYLLLWGPLWLAIGVGFSLLSWAETERALSSSTRHCRGL